LTLDDKYNVTTVASEMSVAKRSPSTKAPRA